MTFCYLRLSTSRSGVSILHKYDYDLIEELSPVAGFQVSILHKYDYDDAHSCIYTESLVVSILHKYDYDGAVEDAGGFGGAFQFYISTIMTDGGLRVCGVHSEFQFYISTIMTSSDGGG